MRAGFDPEDFLRAAGKGEQAAARLGRKLVQDMADDEEPGRGFVQIGRGIYGKRGEHFSGAVGRISGGERRMVPHVEGIKMLRAEGLDGPSPGNPAAAPPIENMAGGGLPIEPRELPEHRVPLPSDPLAERRIVALQVGEGGPIGAAGCLATEEAGAHALKRGPVDMADIERRCHAVVTFWKAARSGKAAAYQ